MRILIVEQYSDTEVLVNCARCKATGRVWPGDSDSRPCWVCSGRGKLLLRVDRLPLVECARCKGSGRLWPGDSDSKECPSCRGAGCQPVTGSLEVV